MQTFVSAVEAGHALKAADYLQPVGTREKAPYVKQVKAVPFCIVACASAQRQ